MIMVTASHKTAAATRAGLELIKRSGGDWRELSKADDTGLSLTADPGFSVGASFVGLAGIEPATSSVSGMRSNRLSYSPGG